MSEPKTDPLHHEQRRSRRPQTNHHLSKSHNRMIAGVAGGFAEFIDANPTVIRWVFGVVTVLTSGFFVLIYALLWLILPKPPDEPVS